jgi:hypothetical protein
MRNIKELLQETKFGNDYEFIMLIEDLDDCVVLEEGIKYFRASVKLRKLVEQLKRKDMKELEPLVEVARRAAMEFERVEGRFERGEITRGQAKLRVDALKRYYAALLKMTRRSDFAKVLKVAGVAAIVGGIIAAILFGFHPFQGLGIAVPTWDQVKNSLGDIQKDVARAFEAIKRVFANKTLTTAINRGAI